MEERRDILKLKEMMQEELDNGLANKDGAKAIGYVLGLAALEDKLRRT